MVRAKENIFLVINTSFFGDVLLCNSLCQNIKSNYPNSKVVFIVNKPFEDAAKFQKDVDEVITYDKKGKNKGILGLFKFIIDFPYKFPFCTFIPYRGERNYLIAMMIGSRHIITETKNNLSCSVQERHSQLITQLKENNYKNLPIKYNPQEILPEHLQGLFAPNSKYIAICPLSKNRRKDLPIETCIDLIKKINSTDYKILLLGVGKNMKIYSEKLKNAGCNYTDLVEKTTIPELAAILKKCKCLISVDTGTMHFGCSVGVPVTALFYIKTNIPRWAPNPELYPSVVISEDMSAENIFKSSLTLINPEKENV